VARWNLKYFSGGAMSLKEYLKKHGLTHGEFAALCGCTRAAVTRWATKSRAPNPKWVRVIEAKTKGEVSAWDLVEGGELLAAIYRKGLTLQAASRKLRISRNLLALYAKHLYEPNPMHAEKIKRHFGVTL
jgi:DNA-binding transcriptional regulator YdaS (Cro superfamily)